MYDIDLAKLTAFSSEVTMRSFGGISVHGATVFTNWLTATIEQAAIPKSNQREINLGLLQKPNWKVALNNALGEVWKTEVLMPNGAGVFAALAAKKTLEQKARPIYPIINSDWKSDAWLCGLAMAATDPTDFNEAGLGFGLTAKPVPEKQHKIPLEPGSYDLLYVDDASYSGTQLFNLLNSVWTSGLRPKTIFLMLAGFGPNVPKKIMTSLALRNKCIPASYPEVSSKMKVWKPPSDTQRLLQTFYGAMSHIEADPRSLRPRSTTGEFPIFMENCLAVLPYKIPDSVSVPTHLYLGINPKTRTSIFESEGGHLFNSDGGVTYREVMAAGAKKFATKKK